MAAVIYPPGPSFWQGLFSGRLFKRQGLGLLLAWQREFGDIVYLRVGSRRLYWLFHPSLTREVLVTQAKRFRRIGREVQVRSEWEGDGLATSEGDYWLKQRRLVQPAFHAKRFPDYARAMTAATSRLVDSWLRDRPPRIEMNSAMLALSLKIMANTLFGTDLTGQTQQLGKAIEVLADYATREISRPFSLPNWVPLPSIRRKVQAMRLLDETIEQIIQERRASKEERDDLLSMLLHAHEEKGGGLTEKQVRYAVKTLVSAGHDTIAGTLPWLWYLLAKNPAAEAKLREELDTVLQGRLPTAEDVPRLSYTQMVVKETLRLYPQGYILFARVAVEDVELGGYRIPRGSQVYPVPYVLHHDERWYPDPERFDPERFTPARFSRLPSCAWIPFGAGPRLCLGAEYASMEMVLIVATIMQRVQLSLVPEQGVPELLTLFSLRLKGDLQMTVSPCVAGVSCAATPPRR